MHVRSWLVPLSATFLLAGAFALHADAPQTSKAAPWWSKPVTRPVLPAAQAPVGGTQEGIVPPILDGTWWKLKVSCKGYSVYNIDGATAKESTKFTAYMLLQANKFEAATGDGGGGEFEGSGFPTYHYSMWVQDTDGSWNFSYDNDLRILGANENGDPTLSTNSIMGFIGPSFLIAAHHTGTLSIKRDSQGVLKSAKLKTIGGELTDCLINPDQLPLGGSTELFGVMTISGATIPFEKLPFIPL